MSGTMLPILIFLILLLSMAGLFYFITGIVNTYSIFQRVESGKNSVKQIIIFGLAGGIWLIFLNYVQRLFFMNGFLASVDGEAPQYPAGLLTGFIQNPEEVRFYWSQITEPGTLSLIWLLLIIVSVISGILFHFRKKITLLQMQLILLSIAILSMVSTIFIKLYVTPVYAEHFAAGHYLRAAICGHVCKDFSLFPYLGYALTGAAFGLCLAGGESSKVLFRKSIYGFITLILIGLIIFLVFDKDKFSGRGTLGAFVTLFELGLFMILLYFLIKKFDFVDIEKAESLKNKSLGLRRFGMLSLTVFIFEPIVAEILKKFINWTVGNHWQEHFGYVFLFALFCLFIWHLILKFWQNMQFAGSVEWLTGKLLELTTGKVSGKTNFTGI
jgi:hypothetical protein